MVHQRQRLPLGLEAGDHFAGVHPQLDHLERHHPPDRLALLGPVDHAHAAFTDLAQDAVLADLLGVFVEGTNRLGRRLDCLWH